MSPPTYWHGLRIRGAEDEQLPPHWRGYALFGRGVTEAIHRMQHAPSFAAWTGSRLRAGELFFFSRPRRGGQSRVSFLLLGHPGAIRKAVNRFAFAHPRAGSFSTRSSDAFLLGSAAAAATPSQARSIVGI